MGLGRSIDKCRLKYALDDPCLIVGGKELAKGEALLHCDSLRQGRGRGGGSSTKLNLVNSSSGFLVISIDKFSIKYIGMNLHGHDVRVVAANRPGPVRRLLHYFEMYVKDSSVMGQFSTGFTSESFKMTRQPG
ncbi:hypothetical protein CRG98_045695 [Punica granatum]|uniref:Uncharacterized protein n=1 Tax=Punica granatum TaxID=22663 RepID=A0A2I0HQQ5_PUNGR|nr:hypothetical protein CRG98_045695 [Punica granatum]